VYTHHAQTAFLGQALRPRQEKNCAWWVYTATRLHFLPHKNRRGDPAVLGQTFRELLCVGHFAQNELDNKLCEGNYYQANNGIDNGVLGAAHVA